MKCGLHIFSRSYVSPAQFSRSKNHILKIRIIKSRSMRGAELVAQMGEKRNAHRLLVGKLEGRRPL
jgi:hypothetical protein